jgi:small subunit ribosomal protein S4e
MTLGKKGDSSTLKRKPAPRFWPIHRKEFTWIVKPAAGPHPIEKCISLTIALRDVLGFAKTRKEAKTIVSQERVLVDGRIRREDDFPIGLMDVVSLAGADKDFRVLPSYRGLTLQPIDKEEAKFKLCRIENKKVLNHGHVQLNFHDGSNIIVKITDPKNPQEDVYETLDTLKLSLPDLQIMQRVEMKEQSFAVITGGKNVGKYGRIVEIEKAVGKKRRNALATIEDQEKNRYQTILDFVFALGEEQPLVALSEVA